MAPSGVVPPTALSNAKVPIPAVKFNPSAPALAPSTVLEKVMLAPVPKEAIVVNVRLFDTVTGEFMAIAPLCVDIFARASM